MTAWFGGAPAEDGQPPVDDDKCQALMVEK